MKVWRGVYVGLASLAIVGVLLGMSAVSRPVAHVHAAGSAPSNEVAATTRSMAERNGDRTASDAAQFVTTTRPSAVKLISADIIPFDGQVYLVKMRGAFHANLARHPAGTAIPTGTFLYLVLDHSTGGVLDWGVSNLDVDLGQLGQVASFNANL